MSDHSAIEERAIAWRLRQEQPGWSEADQAELDAWIEACTAHRVAWLRIGHGWEKVGRLASLRSPDAVVETTAAPAPRPPTRRRAWLMAAGLAAALGLGGVVAVQDLGRRTYVTEIGGHATVPLADGTRVELNTDTRLRADLAEGQRQVWLERGEAFFDVAHDPSRPFVVHAGKRRVTVLGTRFSVRRQGDQVLVAVLDGKVRLEAADSKPPTVVTRGDVVVADPAGALVTPRSIERVENELAWRRGLLVFDKASLADAAEEINRYNRKKLVVTDAEAAALRITGSFEADNTDAFVRLLRSAFGLKVVEEDSEIRVSS